MTWQIKQTRAFARAYKRLDLPVANAVTEAVLVIAENPSIGENKKGDLAKLWVYKFRFQGQLFLLGYTKDDEIRMVWLEAIGSHQNFYRDLKR